VRTRAKRCDFLRFISERQKRIRLIVSTKLAALFNLDNDNVAVEPE
jgi:hypothetical protein